LIQVIFGFFAGSSSEAGFAAAKEVVAKSEAE